MNESMTEKKRFSITPSRLVLAAATIIFIPVLLGVAGNINLKMTTERLQNEIERVEAVSGVKRGPTFCSSKFFTVTCSADYKGLTYDETLNMFSSAGYSIGAPLTDTQPILSEHINATNQTTRTRVTGKQGLTRSVQQVDVTTIMFTDINITQ